MDQFIYEIKAVSLTERTEDDIQKELESFNILHGKNIDMEKFKKFLGDFHRLKYDTSSFPVSFHTDHEEARVYARENIGDFNEAGCYNYAVICRNITGRAYYNSYQDPGEDFEVLKFDREKGQYLPLPKDASEYWKVLEEAWGFIRPVKEA